MRLRIWEEIRFRDSSNPQNSHDLDNFLYYKIGPSKADAWGRVGEQGALTEQYFSCSHRDNWKNMRVGQQISWLKYCFQPWVRKISFLIQMVLPRLKVILMLKHLSPGCSLPNSHAISGDPNGCKRTRCSGLHFTVPLTRSAPVKSMPGVGLWSRAPMLNKAFSCSHRNTWNYMWAGEINKVDQNIA